MRRVATATVALMLASGPASGQVIRWNAPEDLRYVAIDGRDVAAFVSPDSGEPVWIVDVDSLAVNPAAGLTFPDREAVAEATRAFVRAHADDLRLGTTDIPTPAVRRLAGLWIVRFSLRDGTTGGHPGRVGMTFDDGGRVVALGVRLAPSAPASRISASVAPVSAADSLWNASPELDRRPDPHRGRPGDGPSPTRPNRSDRTDGVIRGRITSNIYRSPDDYSSALERVLDVPFRGGRVDLISGPDTISTYADGEGRYGFTGLGASDAYTLRFSMENDRARILSGVETAHAVRDTVIVAEAGDVGGTHDFAWTWGADGDVAGSRTATALSALHHVRAMDAYIRDYLGFAAGDDTDRMNVVIGGPFDCGACTFPNTGKIILTRHYGLSSEVVRHETMHNVLYALSGRRSLSQCTPDGDPDYDPVDAWALEEAFADYFTCASTGDQAFGGPLASAAEPFFPPGAGITVRLLYNELTADDFGPTNTHHANSLVVSGAAWRMRLDAGADARRLDRTLLLALVMEPAPQDLRQFFRNLLAADRYLNGERFRAVIEQRLSERGLYPPLAPGGFVAAIGDSALVLTWEDRSSVEDGYEVLERRDEGAWTVVARLAAGSTHFRLPAPTCTPGLPTTEFRVRAVDRRHGLHAASPARTVDPCLAPDRSRSTASADGPHVGPDAAPRLLPVYPNPASRTVHVEYVLPRAMRIRVLVYDLVGRRVAVIDEGMRPPGTHGSLLDVAGWPSGMYYCRLETEATAVSRPLVVRR